MTNNELFAFINNAESLQETTKKSYIGLLNMLRKHNDNLWELINDPDKYGPIVVQSTCISTQTALFRVIIALLKHSGIKESNVDLYIKWYKDFFEQSNSVVKQKWEEFKQSPKTVEGAMTWQQIIDKYNETARNKWCSLDHVTIGMYTIIPPRRQRDYWKMALIRNEHERKTHLADPTISGYIDFTLSPTTMTVLTYKTQRSYDTWKKLLPAPLERIIKKHLATRPKAKYLFEKMNGDPYPNSGSFTFRNNSILKRVLDNKHASVNVLRHAASTWVFYNNNMTPLEKKNFADDMAHSFETQSHYVTGESPP